MRTAVLLVIIFFAIGFAHGQGRYGESSSSTSSSLSNPFEKANNTSSSASSSRYGSTTNSASNSFDVKPLKPSSGNQSKSSSSQTRSSSNNSNNTLRPNTAKSSSSTNRQYNSASSQPSSTSRSTSTRSSTASNKSTSSAYSNNSSTKLGSSNNLRSNTNRTYSSNSSNNNSTRSSSSNLGSTYNNPRSTSRSSNSTVSANSSRRNLGTRERDAYEMLTNMLKAPRNSQLGGSPTKLASIVSLGETRDKQSQIIDAYWALSSAATDYYLGLHEANELENLKKRVNTYSTSLNEAIIQHATRTDTSLKAARAAQLRLARISGSSIRVLPIDTPFCGPYTTRYSEKFPNGGPEEARILNELIPLRLGELEDAVEAVNRSEQWLAKVAADRSKNTSGTGMIRALELLALSRRAMVMITRDYNLQINRYSQIATPGNIETGRLVAMLIRTPSGGRSSSIASGQTFDSNSNSNLQFRPGGYGSRY